VTGREPWLVDQREYEEAEVRSIRSCGLDRNGSPRLLPAGKKAMTSFEACSVALM